MVLEVIARAKVRPGQLEGLEAQTAEIVRLTRDQDRHTPFVVAALDRALRHRGMRVRFIERKLLTEVRDGGELPVADGSTVRSTGR
jgi:hypothetical protein